MRILIASLCLLLAVSSSPLSAQGGDGLPGVAKAFLDAYAKGDRAAAESYISASDFHFYGSDLAEVADGKEAFGSVFELDQRLWRGGARFGAMRDISSVTAGDVRTLFFNIPFTLGDRQVWVRFSMVWRREAGNWRLVQSSNSVPTVGQSAADLLGTDR